jgi:hypothetical protein
MAFARRLRVAHLIGILAWLGIVALVVRARFGLVLEATHPPGEAAYDLPLILTPSAVEHIGDAVDAWTTHGVAGVEIALRAVAADALATGLLGAAVVLALGWVGRGLTTAEAPDRRTLGRVALRARWFALAAIVLRLGGDVGAGLLIDAAHHERLPDWLDVAGGALAVLHASSALLGAAALAILAVATVWTALARSGDDRSVLRSLLIVRVHLLVVAFFGTLVIAPIIGPQLDDVILRWEQEPGDAAVAALAMLWLGIVLLVVTEHLLVREGYPQRAPPLWRLLAAAAVAGLLGLLAPGLWVLAGLLLALWALSLPFGGMDAPPRRQGLAARREPVRDSLIPVVLAVAPIAMLGIAVVRAAAGEAALSGGTFWWFVAAGIAVPPLVGMVIGLKIMRAPLWIVVGISLVLSVPLSAGLLVNPWRWGDLLGVVGTFACFAVILSLVGFAIAAADLRWPPPPVLLAVGARRLPLIGLLVLWIAGAGLLLGETHYHDIRVDRPPEGPAPRVAVTEAWTDWLARNNLDERPVAARPAGDRRGVPLVLIAASGGGIRAAYWTARVVDCAIDQRAADNCERREPAGARRVFAASGNSGGSLGLASWAAHRASGDRTPGTEWVDERLDEDYFAPAWARTLFADLPASLLSINLGPDRGEVLERAWEQSWEARQTDVRSLLEGPLPSTGALTRRLLSLGATDLPLLLLSGTSVTDGCRTNTSRLRGVARGVDRVCTSFHAVAAGADREQATFGATRDTFEICSEHDLRLSTAALLSARFPIISPAGRVDCGEHPELLVVDGGYFDDSAASPLQELWARLAPLVEAFNSRSADRCVVPVMLQIDNAYVSTAPPPDARPRELAAPLSALLKARFARETGAKQALGVSFGRRRLEDGSLPRARAATGAGVEALERYVQIFPRVQPGAQAPLGWTLSEPSRLSLSGQVQAGPNADALAQVRRWFHRSLRCTR